MSKSYSLAFSLFSLALPLLIVCPTRAASLDVTSGQTIQLGLPGISTNYSFTSVTVETGGTLKISGVVSLTVSSNVLINGQMIGGSSSTAPSGTDGDDGGDGEVIGNRATDGDGGTDAGNGTNAFADAPSLTILAKNMTVNGSILFNPQATGGDGGDGGGGGNGADGPPAVGGFQGAPAGFGGFGGVGGNGGQSLGVPSLFISVVAQGGTLPNAGSFILGTNGVISLDNMGGGGGGGKGGDSGTGGRGGDGGSGFGGGAGGNGGSAGFGGTGGVGAGGGSLTITALGVDLEGQLSLKAGDGGDGGDFGMPMNGGDGGNGSPDPQGGVGGRGGNGGDGGDASLQINPGGAGGNGGFGGNVTINVSVGFTNFAKMDFSGGKGGKGGAGQPEDTAMGGAGGSGAGGAPNGQDGQGTADIPEGKEGNDGPGGSLTVMNPNSGTNAPNNWQTFGNGILTFGLTNNIHTLILSSTNGPFSIVAPMTDPRLQFDSRAGESVVETNEAVQLQFEYQWLTTSGSVDVLLGSRVVAHLNAPTILSNGFTEVTLILAGLPAAATDKLNLTYQLNTPGSAFAQFQLGNISLQALPQLPALSISPSPSDPSVLSLTWFGLTNENYQVQYRTSLTSGAWINLGSLVPGQGTAASASLPPSPADPIRFFRLLATPAN
ncbi:MAG TPA: hypothetical protein VH413_19880 [Verrucomicrobiae bacterium]|jgi:hypothetical protein|nr:hypothetical protein [Verrucomicrobiae bacterium]